MAANVVALVFFSYMGFAFRPTLRKGLLVKSDLPKRPRFAKKVVNHFDATTLWKEEICYKGGEGGNLQVFHHFRPRL